jgi:hypothetical protein
MIKEKNMYAVGERKFKRLATALEYAKKEFVRTGVVLGVEPIVVLNKAPGYVDYLAKGMTL